MASAQKDWEMKCKVGLCKDFELQLQVSNGNEGFHQRMEGAEGAARFITESHNAHFHVRSRSALQELFLPPNALNALITTPSKLAPAAPARHSVQLFPAAPEARASDSGSTARSHCSCALFGVPLNIAPAAPRHSFAQQILLPPTPCGTITHLRDATPLDSSEKEPRQ